MRGCGRRSEPREVANLMESEAGGTGRDWMLGTTEAGDLPPPHSRALPGAKGNYAFSQAVKGTTLRF